MIWIAIAANLISLFVMTGSVGSRLHYPGNGLFVAYVAYVVAAVAVVVVMVRTATS